MSKHGCCIWLKPRPVPFDSVTSHQNILALLCNDSMGPFEGLGPGLNPGRAAKILAPLVQRQNV